MIAIVMPVYNGNDLMNRALYSLITQKGDSLEVFLQDDCSTERLTVPNIRNLPIHYERNEENFGAGATRQRALERALASGAKYIMFLDSDDYYTPHTVEYLFNKIEAENADIVAGKIISEKSSTTHLIEAENQTWVHSKIYKASFLKENNIKFPNLRSNEDLSFNLLAFCAAKRVSFVQEGLYYWEENKQSITRTRSLTQDKCRSTDYINAIYYAFTNAQTPSQILINSIIKCYNYYERALCYGVAEPDTDDKVRFLLHHDIVIVELSNLIYNGKLSQSFDQFVIVDNSIKFFPESYGSWMCRFVDQEKLQEYLVGLGE